MPFGGFFEAPRGGYWGLWGDLVGSLGGFCGPLEPLGAISGSSWGILGPSWDGGLEMALRFPSLKPLLGPDPLGFLGPLGGLRGRLGAFSGRLGAILKASWAVLGAVLGASWAVLER